MAIDGAENNPRLNGSTEGWRTVTECDRADDAEDSARTVSDALSTRQSVRVFLNRPVDINQINGILEKAARAPSGGNLQPWAVRMVHGLEIADLKARMVRLCREKPDGDPMPVPFYPSPLKPAYLARRVENGQRLYAALGIDRDDKAARKSWMDENFQFFNAPLGLFFLMDRSFGHYQWLDLGIYLQSVMLLLREAGLDSCAQADWAMYAPTLQTMLAVPSDLMLICGMAVGYRDPAAPVNQVRTARVPPFLDSRPDI